MKSFKPPKINDLVRLVKILTQRVGGSNATFFAAHGGAWSNVWKEYLTKKANATEIAAKRTPWIGVSSALRNLYPGSPGHDQTKYIKNLRRKFKKDSYLLCPYCGRPAFEVLDHYLPKSQYPEFSILSKNLVPSCGDCNDLKDDIIPGGKDDFFIHPYYDKDLSNQLLKFEIRPPYDTPQIKLNVMPTLAPKIRKRLRFQVRELNLKSRLRHEALRELRAIIDLLASGSFTTYADFLAHLDRCCSAEIAKYKSRNSTPYLILNSIRNDTVYLGWLRTRYRLP